MISIWNCDILKKKKEKKQYWIKNPTSSPLKTLQASTGLTFSFQGIEPYATHDISNEAQFPVYLSAPSPPPWLSSLFFSPSNLTRWHLISWWVEDVSPHQPCSVADLFRLGHSSAIREPTLPLHARAPLGTNEGNCNVMLKLTITSCLEVFGFFLNLMFAYFLPNGSENLWCNQLVSGFVCVCACVCACVCGVWWFVCVQGCLLSLDCITPIFQRKSITTAILSSLVTSECPLLHAHTCTCTSSQSQADVSTYLSLCILHPIHPTVTHQQHQLPDNCYQERFGAFLIHLTQRLLSCQWREMWVQCQRQSMEEGCLPKLQLVLHFTISCWLFFQTDGSPRNLSGVNCNNYKRRLLRL